MEAFMNKFWCYLHSNISHSSSYSQDKHLINQLYVPLWGQKISSATSTPIRFILISFTDPFSQLSEYHHGGTWLSNFSVHLSSKTYPCQRGEQRACLKLPFQHISRYYPRKVCCFMILGRKKQIFKLFWMCLLYDLFFTFNEHTQGPCYSYREQTCPRSFQSKILTTCKHLNSAKRWMLTRMHSESGKTLGSFVIFSFYMQLNILNAQYAHHQTCLYNFPSTSGQIISFILMYIYQYTFLVNC